MITIYSLILTTVLAGSGIHTTSLDFNTKAACEQAAAVARHEGRYDRFAYTIAYCVERR